MTKRYTGGVVSSSLPTVNSAGASGVFLLSQQADYQSRNSWPPFKVEESLRFRSSASAYLNRTFTASNRRTFTFSAWVKRGSLTGNQNIFGPNTSTSGSGTYGVFRFVDGSIEFFDYTNGTHNAYFYTSSSQYTFRDPSAWYHLVLAVDTTQATGSNRIKVYVNGTQITGTFYTTPTQNVELQWNNNLTHYLGTAQIGGSNQYFDGYLAEVNFIDGQQLTPSSFGATDKDGNWSPIAYTGTYGTNGFYVNFRDNTSATTMGYDYSGNGNNWTLNGFNVSTANTTYDIMIDVPEDQSDGTANNRGNYATFNPLVKFNSTPTFSEGNLKITSNAGNYQVGISTIGIPPNSGKWYWESTASGTMSSGTYSAIMNDAGIRSMTVNSDYATLYGYGTSTYSSSAFSNNYYYYAPNTYLAYSPAVVWNNGDTVCWAYDSDNGRMWIGKNGVWNGNNSGVVGNPSTGSDPLISSIPSETWYPAIGTYTHPTLGVTAWFGNFGQRPFAYAPPSGFKALNTFNLPEPTIKQPNKYFDATLYTSTGTTQTVTNSGGMQPDFVWQKVRSDSQDHYLFDAVRGSSKWLESNTTDAEGTSATFLTSFNSDGVTWGTGNLPNGWTNVIWQWNAGGSTVTNTAGSISSQVRANPTAGFSIVTWTGNVTSGATIGHGLSAVPSMVIVKNRSAGSTNWCVYHVNIGNTKADLLNRTDGPFTNTNYWNNTTPTSSVFSLGNSTDTNGSGNSMVAYCFAPIAGYSAFGSYTGNGSTDGPFVHTGFRPRFVMFKRTTSADPWIIHDTARDIYNGYSVQLYPNTSGVEGGPYSPPIIDELSNGFKCRSSASGTNGSGDTFIYMAFAEMPFKYSRSR